MISFKEVCFGYEKQKVLFENLNLQLGPGRIYGLLGKNGEGKSSLLRNMAGLLFPNKGTINVAGFKPADRQAEFLQEVFFIPEETYLPVFTVKKFAERYGKLYPNYNANEFHTNLSGFSIDLNDRLDKLSYGQRKKAFIAFALACNTKVVLMDEPTNGLDVPSKIQFRKLVLSALNEDRTIVIATHQVRDLENLIYSVIILNENKVMLQTELDTVSQCLSFDTYSEIEEDDESLLFAQSSPNGHKVVTRNIFGIDSRIDLEQFFNAVIQSPIQIRKIFEQHPSHSN